MGAVILVRHTEISSDWKGRCYGVSDVPLSDAGIAAIAPIAEHLAGQHPQRIFHSGLTRTQKLAMAIAEHCNSPIEERTAFRELNFGTWEGRPWTAIFAETGHAMARMITEPETYAPHGGETVCGVRNRVISALLQIPPEGIHIVITHGGPMGAVRGTLKSIPAREWPDLVPDYGGTITLSHGDLSKLKLAIGLES